MTPETSVFQFAEIIRSLPEFSEEQAHLAMTGVGIPSDLADHTFKFTQIAWGRALLSNLGITFSSDYIWLNASGEVAETGLLAQNPFFVAASGIAERYASSKGFQSLALTSAEVNAINSALNQGSDPCNLKTACVVLFSEPPTVAGLQRAQQIPGECFADLSKHPTKRPATRAWWQFWK